MKRISIPILLLCGFINANAKKIAFGGNGGFLTFNSSTTTVLPGDTIAIKPGLYRGFNFTNLKGSAAQKIVIINDKGLVEISGTSPSTMQNTTNVVLTGTGSPNLKYGFYFHDISARGLEFKGKVDSTVFSNLKFERITDYAVFMSNTTVYNGTSTTIIQNIKLLHSWFKKTGTPFNCGNYGNVADRLSVTRNIEVAYCIVDSIQTGDVFRFYKGFDVNIHHNRITNTGLGIITHNGVIYLKGDGEVHHNYFRNVWGNCMRGSGVGLNEVGDIYFYNNICVGSRKYSAVELRTLPEDTSKRDVYPYTTICNYYVYNNTMGNQKKETILTASNPLRMAMVDVYDFFGAKCIIKNNLGFNIESDMPYDSKRNYIYGLQKTNKPDTSNNIYRRNYEEIGFIDTIDCKLSSKSIAIDKGIVNTLIKDDFAGTARPQGKAPDIGGIEYSVTTSLGDIDLFEKKDLTLYPNPASNAIQVSYDSRMEKISITDQNGRVVAEQKNVDQSATEVNILDLARGIYHVSVETGDGTLTKSFIKH